MLDDFMQSEDVVGDKESEAVTVIYLINSAEYALHMANADLKGRVIA